MILEAERLLLEEVNLADAPFIFQLLNSPTWIKFIGDKGIKTLDDAKNYIQNSLIKSYSENGFGLYKMVLKENQKAIGLCGLVNRKGLEHVDIGFAILPKYAQKGYTFEAAKATVQFAKTNLGLTTILAITTEENINSKKLLERIGLKFSKKIKLGKDESELFLFSNQTV